MCKRAAWGVGFVSFYSMIHETSPLPPQSTALLAGGAAGFFSSLCVRTAPHFIVHRSQLEKLLLENARPAARWGILPGVVIAAMIEGVEITIDVYGGSL